MSNSTDKNAPEGYILISDAVRLSGVARSTFYDYISTKKIDTEIVNFKGKDKKFISNAEFARVFGETSGKQSAEQSEPNTSEQVRTPDVEASEVVRLRTENAVLLARLEEVRAANTTAERDKENLTKLLADSLATVKFLELRSTETAHLIGLRKNGDIPAQDVTPEGVQDAQYVAQDEKKPGWLSRFFG